MPLMTALGELVGAAPEPSRNLDSSNVQFVPKWISSRAVHRFVAPPSGTLHEGDCVAASHDGGLDGASTRERSKVRSLVRPLKSPANAAPFWRLVHH
jgi:hypothetical protein